MANLDIIGFIDCGECGEEAELKQSKKHLAYYVCDNCGSQHFARGPASDAAMRARARGLEPEKHTETDEADEAAKLVESLVDEGHEVTVSDGEQVATVKKKEEGGGNGWDIY